MCSINKLIFLIDSIPTCGINKRMCNKSIHISGERNKLVMPKFNKINLLFKLRSRKD